MIVGQGRGKECGAAFFGTFSEAPHDQKAFLVRTLRHQFRARFVPERPDAAVIAPAVIERIKRITLQPRLIERLGLQKPRPGLRRFETPGVFREPCSKSRKRGPVRFLVKVRRHAVPQGFLVIGHERTAPHLLQAADRLFLRQFDHGGPGCIIHFGTGRPERETVRGDGFDLFVLLIEILGIFETLKERCPFVRPPEFTVADRYGLLASGLGKKAHRGAQPYAFMVVFGGEDAGVRLSLGVSLPVSRLSPLRQSSQA